MSEPPSFAQVEYLLCIARNAALDVAAMDPEERGRLRNLADLRQASPMIRKMLAAVRKGPIPWPWREAESLQTVVEKMATVAAPVAPKVRLDAGHRVVITVLNHGPGPCDVFNICMAVTSLDDKGCRVEAQITGRDPMVAPTGSGE